MRILIVEDEPKVAAFLKKGLEEENCIVHLAYDGQQGLKLLRCSQFDVIVLDIMLPKTDGLTVLKIMRSEKDDTPVLLLTARDSVPDRVKGLRSGADDYLVKPFAFEELLARLHALVRRKSSQVSEILQAADLEIDTFSHIVKRAGQIIELSASEYRLLEYLLRNKGNVVSPLDIEEYAWDVNYYRESNIVAVHMNHLRKKIDKPFNKPLIKTVRGFGYKLEAPDED